MRLSKIRKILDKIVFGMLLALPFFVFIGVIDYHFHNYFWPSFDQFRILVPMRKFDLFSIFDMFLLPLFVFAGVQFALNIKQNLKNLWKIPKWVLVAAVLLLMGLPVSKITYLDIDPPTHSFWFQIYQQYLVPIAVSVILYINLNTKKRLKMFITSLLHTTFLFGFVILLQAAFRIFPAEPFNYLNRLTWPYVDPFTDMQNESSNFLSYIFAPAFILSSICVVKSWLDNSYFEKNKNLTKVLQFVRNNIMHLLIILVAGSIILLTKSYTGIISVFLIVGYFIFMHVSARSKVALVLIGAIMVSGYVFSQRNTDRFKIATHQYDVPSSVDRRVQIYNFNKELFVSHPLYGIGPGNYQSYFRNEFTNITGDIMPEKEVPPHPHFLAMHFWSQLGMFGLIAIGLLYVYTISLSLLKLKKSVFILPFAYFLLHGLFDVSYFLPEDAMLFWIYLVIYIMSDKMKLLNI